jgi:hypothetical protein
MSSKSLQLHHEFVKIALRSHEWWDRLSLEEQQNYVRKHRTRFRPNAVTVDGISYVKPSRAKNQALIIADIDKIDKLWKKQPVRGLYIGPNDPGDRGKRQGFVEFLQTTSEPIEAPEISVTDDYVGFTNGRHRFSVIRDMGKKQIAVCVSKSEYKKALETIV